MTKPKAKPSVKLKAKLNPKVWAKRKFRCRQNQRTKPKCTTHSKTLDPFEQNIEQTQRAKSKAKPSANAGQNKKGA